MLRRLIKAFLGGTAAPASSAQAPVSDRGPSSDLLRQGAELEHGGKLDAAVERYRSAVCADPSDAHAHAALANALHRSWRNEECIEACVQAVNATAFRPELFSGLLMFSHYAAAPNPRALFELHRIYGRRMSAAVTPTKPQPRSCDPSRRLRVGYVSRDLRLHSVTDFLEPVILHHDRSAFEVHCYFTQQYSDAVTERLARAVDGWHHVPDNDAGTLADAVAADEIDILVDLAGHTKRNALPAFARRPAPVQITWLGYPDTTGLPAIDYRLTDDVADPAPEADANHSERLLRLPGPFVCYRPPVDAPPVRASKHGAGVVFGCFNMFSKVNDPLLRLWSQILRAVPGSTLLIKSSLLSEKDSLARARSAFTRHGIDDRQLDIRPWTTSRDNHLGIYNEVDVALDTFPYNGTTTSCEALWMAVPVVTLAGGMHMSRVGATLLRAVGLEELVAQDPQQYVDVAVGLALDAARRHELATGMRERLASSPLLDHAGFTRRLEEAYRGAWRAWCEKKALRDEGLS